MSKNSIIIDAMGGDNAPCAVVDGCYQALADLKDIQLILVGHKGRILECIEQKGYDRSLVEIVHAEDIITNHDSPVEAVKYKTDSSLVKCFHMLKSKEGDAVVSAGNSGAMLTGSVMLVGRIDGVKRPALGAVLPSPKGKTLLIDAGLNTNCRSENYVQFARFGSIYMNALYDIKEPTVRLLNVGAEEAKGNDDIKEAFQILKNTDLNFLGNAEGNEILGDSDVVATNGYTGNAILKFYESCGDVFFKFLQKAFTKNILTKASYFMIKKDLKKFKDSIDPDIHGGAPVLGIKELVMKSHGSSIGKTFKNVILKTNKLINAKIVTKLQNEFVT
jgi:glycerol-3-phosphate acyltransferase PlsX